MVVKVSLIKETNKPFVDILTKYFEKELNRNNEKLVFIDKSSKIVNWYKSMNPILRKEFDKKLSVKSREAISGNSNSKLTSKSEPLSVAVNEIVEIADELTIPLNFSLSIDEFMEQSFELISEFEYAYIHKTIKRSHVYTNHFDSTSHQ